MNAKNYKEALRVSGADCSHKMKIEGCADFYGYAQFNDCDSSFLSGCAVYKLAGYYEEREAGGEPIPFAVGQVVKTRDGRNARILAVDAKGACPVISLIERGEFESACSHTNNGNVWPTCTEPRDLIQNTKTSTKRVVFVPVKDGEA